jgi:O-antigen/teichoic acid export membrane protein
MSQITPPAGAPPAPEVAGDEERPLAPSRAGDEERPDEARPDEEGLLAPTAAIDPAVDAAARTAPESAELLAPATADEPEEAVAESAAYAEALAAETDDAARHADTDRSLVSGVAWTGGVKLMAQLLTWVSTFVVARHLSHEDYGLVGYATMYMALVTLLSEFGIGSAVIVLRRLTRDQVAQINTLAVLFGVGGFVISCLMAVPLARFFNAPLLPPVIVAMSGAFIVSSFRTVPQSLLQRDMRFKRLAVFEAANAVVVALASVVLAVNGFGYWTLVAANLLGAALSTGMVLAQNRHPFAVPHLPTLTEALNFSKQLIVGRLSFFWLSQSDNLLAGKFLGQGALGHYGFAYTLSMSVLEKTSGMVLRVTPALFARVQDDPPALRRYLLGLTQGISFVTFPLTIGMALVANDFVLAVLGEQWRPMVRPLQLLAAYAAVRSLLPLCSQLLVATRKGAKRDARQALLTAVVMPGAFFIGSHWGITGIAAAWVLVHPFFARRLMNWALQKVNLTFRDYFRSWWPAASSAAIMAAAVVAADIALPASVPPVAVLATKIGVGAVAYVAAVFVLHRQRVLAFRQLYRSIRK